jgi:acyl carrier protein
MIPAAETVRTAARLAVTRIANTSVSDTEPLLSSGLLDSLSLPRLIGEIEKTLSLRLPPGDLQPDDFNTIESIVTTVLRGGRP